MEVTSVVEIARPVDEVFAAIADMSRNPEWQNGMQTCMWITEPPIRVGSVYDQVASFMGKEILTTFEVTDYEPPSSIRIESVVSTFPLDVTRTVVATSSGSQVTAIVKGEPTGLMRLFNPIMKLQVRRSVRADYGRLKQLLEAAT